MELADGHGLVNHHIFGIHVTRPVQIQFSEHLFCLALVLCQEEGRGPRHIRCDAADSLLEGIGIGNPVAYGLNEVAIIPPGHDAVSGTRIDVLAVSWLLIFCIEIHSRTWRIVLQPCGGGQPVRIRPACALSEYYAHGQTGPYDKYEDQECSQNGFEV